MQKYYTIVTDLGTELIAQAAQKEQKVNIVHIAAGDGDGAFYNPTSDMTTLKREIWRGAILNYEVDALAKNVIKVSGIIPKDVGSFVLREMALFDDNNNMIAICNAPDLLKAVLEEGALTEAVVYMRIAVTNSEAVNITINGSAVFATQEELEAHKSDENAHQELFDKKVDKTNFTGQKIGEMLETAGWDSEKTLEALQGLETHKTDPNAHQELFDKKVDNTEFTGAKIGEMLKTVGWENDKTLEKLETHKNDQNAHQVLFDKKLDKTEFTGIKIGEMLTAAGWNNGGSGEMTALEIMEKFKETYGNGATIILGYQAGLTLRTDSMCNTLLGGYAGKAMTDASYNTAVGCSTLMQCTTGYNNTAIGDKALSDLKTYSLCTGVGAHSQVTGDKQVQLGGGGVTVYAQTAVQTRSDARDKLDIQDTVLGLDFITKLTPRQFRMNSRELYFEQGQKRDYSKIIGTDKAGKRFHQGFVAQEVKQVLDDMQVDFAGYQDHKINGGEDVLSLDYTEFIAPIVKAIQEQQQLIQQQQQKIEQLEQKIKEVIA